MCTKHRQRKRGHGGRVCWDIMLKILMSKLPSLLYKMIPASAVGSLDYSQSKTRLKETREEATALV